jgi:hypothetical protein
VSPPLSSENDELPGPSVVKARDWVAIILALGIVVSINLFAVGVLYDAIASSGPGRLSENATQVLTLAFGGIIGLLGSYVGYKTGAASVPPVPDAPKAPGTDDHN